MKGNSVHVYKTLAGQAYVGPLTGGRRAQKARHVLAGQAHTSPLQRPGAFRDTAPAAPAGKETGEMKKVEVARARYLRGKPRYVYFDGELIAVENNGDVLPQNGWDGHPIILAASDLAAKKIGFSEFKRIVRENS